MYDSIAATQLEDIEHKFFQWTSVGTRCPFWKKWTSDPMSFHPGHLLQPGNRRPRCSNPWKTRALSHLAMFTICWGWSSLSAAIYRDPLNFWGKKPTLPVAVAWSLAGAWACWPAAWCCAPAFGPVPWRPRVTGRPSVGRARLLRARRSSLQRLHPWVDNKMLGWTSLHLVG
jgi:hypothetical protein